MGHKYNYDNTQVPKCKISYHNYTILTPFLVNYWWRSDKPELVCQHPWIKFSLDPWKTSPSHYSLRKIHSWDKTPSLEDKDGKRDSSINCQTNGIQDLWASWWIPCSHFNLPVLFFFGPLRNHNSSMRWLERPQFVLLFIYLVFFSWINTEIHSPP